MRQGCDQYPETFRCRHSASLMDQDCLEPAFLRANSAKLGPWSSDRNEDTVIWSSSLGPIVCFIQLVSFRQVISLDRLYSLYLKAS